MKNVDVDFAELTPLDESYQDFGGLLENARLGVSEVAGRLLNAYRPYLLSIAAEARPVALGGKIAPSDLVQETIVKGYEQLGMFRGNTPEELAGWLKQILLNHAINTVEKYQTLKRQASRERPVSSDIVDAGQSSPSHVALSREKQERLEHALERLPEHYRQVILLRHRENLSFGDIGQALGKTDEAARKLWGRAVHQLQQELGFDDASRPIPAERPTA